MENAFCQIYPEGHDIFHNLCPEGHDIQSMRVNISCEAKNCVHNDDCHCHADRIDVAGSNACRCEQTGCGTFRMR